MKPLASTRYRNAVVWTGFGNPLQDSLTIANGIVISNDSPADEVIDCEGRAILPAFIDGHSHPSIVAKSALGPDVTDCKNIAEVVRKVSNWISLNPAAKWAVGGSYDRSMADGGRFLATWLDEASTEIAIVLHASDQHTIWANSEAIRQAGIAGLDVLPEGVETSADGHPTGMFYEAAAKALVLKHVPEASIEDLTASLQVQLELLSSFGIAATLDAWGDAASANLFARVRSDVEVRQAVAVSPEDWEKHLGAQTAKFFVDGVLGAQTALVTQGYVSDHSHGSAFWQQTALEEALSAFDDAGARLHVHAIGDGAVEMVLAALEQIGPTMHPASIAHAELLLDDQIQRIAELGLFVCAQPLWARVDSLSVGALANLGPERSKMLYRHRDLLDAGGSLSFGSDWPVSSPDPLLGIFTAIYRHEPDSDQTLNLNQTITLDEAIRCYTETSSKQIGLSRSARLEPGEPADFVVLSANPFEDNGASLPKMHVAQLVSGGQTVFTRH